MSNQIIVRKKGEPEAASQTDLTPEAIRRSYRARGGSREALSARDAELVVHGPAGTGKSRGILEKLYTIALKYAGTRLAIVRRYRNTITQSALVTFDNLVRIPGDSVLWHGNDNEYRFPNGSKIIVAGLDDPEKIFSTEYDVIYVQECTEIDESTWEALNSRLRWGVTPYQQLIGDCNPASERHWIMQRWRRGVLRMIRSEHKDNPLWWDEDSDRWTDAGERYINRLKALSGVMRQRMYEGKWVGTEGVIFTEYKPDQNLIPRRFLPFHWPRYITVDFGYTNPFVAQWWAVDPDGRMFMYRELYGSQVPVEDWAHEIHDYIQGADEEIQAIICDHDAEDRATLERHITHSANDCYAGREHDFKNLPKGRRSTIAADKRPDSVRAGIEQVQVRMRPAGDGRPRLFFFQNTRVNDPDDRMLELKKPTCTIEEIDAYEWDKTQGGRLGERQLEKPRKIDDHGMDAMRYMVRYLDGRGDIPASVWGTSVKNQYGRQTTPKDVVDALWPTGKTKTSFWD